MKNRAFFVLEKNIVFELHETEVTIGRSQNNDLVVNTPQVSRAHAKVSNINGQYILLDLNSSGGTYVNGNPIIEKLLQAGDMIDLAHSYKILFETDSSKLPENLTNYQTDNFQSLDGSTSTSTLNPDLLKKYPPKKD